METYFDLKQAADSRLQNKINRSMIFHYLHEHGQSTRVQIARAIRISEPTVSRITADLLEQGYILEAGKVVTGGGKRPSLIKVNPNKGYIAVVDLVKARLRIAITNFNGDVIAKKDGSPVTDSAAICGELIEAIRIFFRELREDPPAGFDERLLLALCVGMPAVTDPHTGAPTGGSLYDSWYGIPFKTIMEEALKVPVFIERDVVLSVIAEKNYGAGKDYRNIAYVEVSNGVATGIIMDNRVIRSMGALGFAGEPEYVRSIRKEADGHVATHYDKHFGSIRRLEEEAQRRIEAGAQSQISRGRGSSHHVSAADVFMAAHTGDALARELVAGMVDVLSRGIGNLVLILDPEIVVIGGELSTMPHIEELFLLPIRERIDRLVPFEMPLIQLFSMHEDAIFLGGAVAAMDNLLLEEFPYKGRITPLAEKGR
jgi:glucokinase